MPQFVQGLELSRRFYLEVVKPILDRYHPGLCYAAALIGPGSEVQGWDDEQSTDHHWGPRLQLFVLEEEMLIVDELVARFRERLPHRFLGFATSFSPPDEFGTRLPLDSDTGPVEHMIECTTVAAYFHTRLGVSDLENLSDEHWFNWPSQILRELIGGEVYYDGGLATLTAARRRLAWYPKSVWYELMARQWKDLNEEEPLVGRASAVGDDLGSRVLASRQVQRMMTLALLMAKQYPPYGKWFGKAFAALSIAERLRPHIEQALMADNWQDRQQHLADAYQVVGQNHNDLKLTEPLSTEIRPFHNRPFLVLGAARFAKALRSSL